MVFSVVPSWRSSFAYCHHSGIRMKFLFVNEVLLILQHDRGSIKKAKLHIVFTLLRKVLSIRQTEVAEGNPAELTQQTLSIPQATERLGEFNLGYQQHRKSSDKLK